MSGFKLLDDSNKRDKPEGVSNKGVADQPLGMTVHNLSLSGAAQGVEVSPSGGRWKMLAVFLVCAAPVIASYFMYYVVRPEGRRNFGELIEPQKPLPDLSTQSLLGTKASLKTLKDQWLLISVSGGACDEACARHLYLQRQLLEGMGKEKDRIDWIWLIQDEGTVPAKILPALKDATVLRLPMNEIATWLVPAKGRKLNDHLYLVDPMGNWMMRFPADLDLSTASKAKKDMERLLRASDSWDKAGRDPAHMSSP
jgi:hypothetical protein